MLRKVRTAVKEETGGQQVPWENGLIEGIFYFNGMSGGTPQQSQTLPATIVGNDGAEMVLVPAGEFSMGSDRDELDRLKASRESFGNEIPWHRVYLDAFYIDKYEVTNARFQQFVQATGHRTQAERDEDFKQATGHHTQAEEVEFLERQSAELLAHISLVEEREG
jgi:formylglycine-generating enzyme required for sulfatase activity